MEFFKNRCPHCDSMSLAGVGADTYQCTDCYTVTTKDELILVFVGKSLAAIMVAVIVVTMILLTIMDIFYGFHIWKFMLGG